MSKETEMFKNFRKRYCQVTWTHKTHEKQADIYSLFHNAIVFFLLLFDALSVGSVLSLFSNDSFLYKIMAFIIAFTTALLNSLIKTNQYKEKAIIYKKSAAQFLIIRNEMERINSGYLDGIISDIKLLDKFNKIDHKLEIVYKNTPITTNLALKLAEKSLLKRKDNYISKDEIEAMLGESK